ncbi:conserved hypothetical protein [Paenibacillus curdlanolyticus YK9]|uniref:ABC-2 family transporter protein n=1 Tax=Paenibacillus curdlanolyticus YK9 TaxID=717606 RepID=E0I7U2_9BACL|nr:hypothetical protein [Paenibacillus curdlanolyticus]EFM11247.1 conserved hypothetical protein [Paenibacillus curdlanolyticus YK9]
MNDLQGAWHIAKHEWKKDWIGLLFILVFIGYMLTMTLPFFRNAFDPSQSFPFGWAVDFLQIAILPVLGFPMNRTLFRAWREDSFTNKIMHWRILPISVRQIVAARQIQLFGILSAALFIYFAVQYAISPTLQEHVGIVHYIGYSLCWFGYAMGIGATYTFWEQGFSGKLYTIASFGYVVIYFLIPTLMNSNEESISIRILTALESGNWWYTVGALLLAAILCAVSYWGSVRRLSVRVYNR